MRFGLRGAARTAPPHAVCGATVPLCGRKSDRH